MSITIPVSINTTANRSIDIDALKAELVRYAAILVKSMSTENKDSNTISLHRTSPFVESLSLKGGNPVPTDIKMEDLYAE